MENLKSKSLSLANLLTSSSSQKLIIFLLTGLILIGFGVLSYKTSIFSSGDKVEVLNSVTDDQNNTSEIVVEISGAIEKPGVYKMKSGGRVDDLLIVAGGLSVDADRDWVTKNINRASKLIDGQKLYIYSQSEVASAKTSGGIKLDQGVLGAETVNSSGLVNINTASLTELDKLPEIGQERGKSIIEHRPYSNVQELVTKGAIGQKILEKIRSSISL